MNEKQRFDAIQAAYDCLEDTEFLDDTCEELDFNVVLEMQENQYDDILAMRNGQWTN